MDSNDFTSIRLIRRKKDTLLLKGCRGDQTYFIKAVSPGRQDLVHALQDEYAVMSRIRHPGVPAYYEYSTRFSREIPPEEGGAFWHAVFMEYLDGDPLSLLLPDIRLEDFLSLLSRTGHILGDLYAEGVLYTDLNPGNILVRNLEEISLVDYTGAYFYRHNPNPDYTLRFSYRLSPELAGEQLLIQELALMLNMFLMDYEEKKEGSHVPSSIYLMLESGLHPPDHLTLADYLSMLP